MTYIRSKMINGCGPYYYEVRSVRDGDTVQQKYVRYIGKNRPTTKAEGQANISHYDGRARASSKSKVGSSSKRWTTERRRRAEIVAGQVGCSVVEADGLIRRAKSKGYEYDEVDWDRLQGKDLEYSERVEKLERQVGETRTRREAKSQHRQAQRSMREAEKRKERDGENYDPEDDLELQYAYQTAKTEYYEERGAGGHRSAGREMEGEPA